MRPVIVIPGIPSVSRTKRVIMSLLREGVSGQNALTGALRRVLPDLPCEVFGDAVTELLHEEAITIHDGIYALGAPASADAGRADTSGAVSQRSDVRTGGAGRPDATSRDT